MTSAARRGAGTLVRVPGASSGGAVPLRSSDSAMVQFFSPDNWELLIKVLDGRNFNDRFWVFLAAATDVEYVTSVTDTACGTTREYVNRLGRASPAVTDTSAFPECGDPQPPTCIADDDTICLGENGRFQVELRWTDFLGDAGVGRQVFLEKPGHRQERRLGPILFFQR